MNINLNIPKKGVFKTFWQYRLRVERVTNSKKQFINMLRFVRHIGANNTIDIVSPT